MAAGIYTVVQVMRPVAAPSIQLAWVTAQRQSADANLSWPSVRESAVTVSGLGRSWESGTQGEVPIASVTKMMTAYLVLKDHPLPGGGQGPSMTITTADVNAYKAGIRNQDSSVKIVAGESLTERQALEALMLPSADDIAWVLGEWDAGSDGTFVTKMNAQAQALGMDHTNYTDPSGLSASTMSTAHDQLILVQRAMAIPAFAQIVSMTSAQIPVQGTITNYNEETGENGVLGVKTGSDSAAGGCWAFAVQRKVSGTERTVYGVVLGSPGDLNTMVPIAVNDGLALADDVSRNAVQTVTALPAGTVVGYITVPWSKTPVPVTTTRALTGTAVAGAHVTLRAAANVPGGDFTAHQKVGRIEATGLLSGTGSTPVVTNGPSGKPSFQWRLSRP